MNKKAVLEGLLFVVGDEGITMDEIMSILEIDSNTAKELVLSLKNDYLNEIYANDIEGAKEDLRVLEITPKEAAYLDHRTHPIFTRKFEF